MQGGHNKLTHTLLPPLYSHYTGQPALAGTPRYELESFAVASFTVRMPLLTATSAFGLGRRP